jgi:hypothetical protein
MLVAKNTLGPVFAEAPQDRPVSFDSLICGMNDLIGKVHENGKILRDIRDRVYGPGSRPNEVHDVQNNGQGTAALLQDLMRVLQYELDGQRIEIGYLDNL